MRPQFASDLRKEQLLQPFLDRCYGRYGIHAARCGDIEHQREGIDLFLSRDGLTLSVDEKAQLHYIGASLPTFALEVDLLKGGTRSPGWLFDRAKVTQVYAFVFDIRLHGGETTLVRRTQVCSATIILVNRQRLIAALGRVGLDQEALQHISTELRSSGDQRRRVPSPGCSVVLSRQFDEQPVNLLVRRDFLRSIGQQIQW